MAGLPIFWIDELPFGPDECVLSAGLVTTQRSGLIERMCARGYSFRSVIYPSAIISRRATIGAGCIVNAGAVISQSTSLAPHVIINRGALIGHDVRIEPFCTIGPGANIAGGVEIGSGTYVGVGAVVRDHVIIGGEAVIAAGAVVVKAVAANTLVAGVPAQAIRNNVKGL